MKKIRLFLFGILIACTLPLFSIEVELFWSPDNWKTIYPMPVYLTKPGKVLVRVQCGDPVLEPQDGNWFANIKRADGDFASAFTGKPPYGGGMWYQRPDPTWTAKTKRSVDFEMDVGERGEGVMGKANSWDNAQKKFVDAPLPACSALSGTSHFTASINYKDKTTGQNQVGLKDFDVIIGVFPADLKALSGGQKIYPTPSSPIVIHPEQIAGNISSTYLGAHYSASSITLVDWELVVPRRFPSHGLGSGSLFRTFLPQRPKLTETLNGVRYERVNRDWWGHIQSSAAERGFGPEAPYRYYESDFWMILAGVEKLGGVHMVLAPGFPWQTKETAAAAVAFANGKVGDNTVIGIDKWGFDWKTVGYWAEKRASGDERHPAHPNPFGVRYWEIGNELYYSHNSTSWSNWLYLENYDNTAEGRNSATRAKLYLEGRDYNGEHCDGYFAFVEAMKKVDSSIQVGAMLAPEHKAKWHWDWNDTLLKNLKTKVDFLSYHGYTHASSLNGEGVALQAGKEGREYITSIRKHMSETGMSELPLINSEWHPYEPLKSGSIQMVTAIYVADMLGVMLEEGVSINAAYVPFDTKHSSNGGWTTMVRPLNASDYRNVPAGEGIYDRPTAFRWPAYYAFYLWKDFGNQRLTLSNPWDITNQIAVYAGKQDKIITCIAVNKTASKQMLRIKMPDLFGSARIDEVFPKNNLLQDEDVVFNNIDMSTPEAQKLDDLDLVAPAGTKDGSVEKSRG